MKLLMRSTSGVSTNAHCTRTGSAPLRKSMSPRPISCWAPVRSRMVFESIPADTLKAIRAGKLALMLPVMMVVVGLCVAMTMCIPTARASCAIRAIGNSISLPAVMIRSPNSSMITTIYGMYPCPPRGGIRRSINFLLYSLMFLAPTSLSRS